MKKMFEWNVQEPISVDCFTWNIFTCCRSSIAAVLAVRRLFVYHRLSVEALLMDGHLQDAGLLLQAWPRLAAGAWWGGAAHAKDNLHVRVMNKPAVESRWSVTRHNWWCRRVHRVYRQQVTYKLKEWFYTLLMFSPCVCVWTCYNCVFCCGTDQID